jgi:hypothetical protein
MKVPIIAAAELRYASWLDWGARLGFVALLLAFVAYLSGIVPTVVPIADLPRLWGLSAADYARATGMPVGWGWFGRLAQGESIAIAAMAALASVTMLCFARLIPIFVAARDRVYLWICLAELLVLVAAAAGIGGSGH